MKIKFIFTDWRKRGSGKSIYDTEEGIDLSMGQFHSGTTFDGEIRLDLGDEEELIESLKKGFIPVFEIDNV